MDAHIRTLTLHDVRARAKAAVDLGIPHDEANHFNPHREPYHCTHCHQWHLGTNKKADKRAKRAIGGGRS